MAKKLDSAHVPTLGAVFLDPTIPDLKDLIDGAAPGEKVFVLKPGQNGLSQIAADLAAAHLTHLSSIAIVAHGASGSLKLGSTTLDNGDLGAHKAALRAIGAALGPKGKLELYACDVAAGASGRAFIADLSRDAGGADVAASTQAIGQTPTGENWTLDASTVAATKPAVAPFTAAATHSYQGTLATPTGIDGQLIGDATTTGTPDGESFYLNSNGSALQSITSAPPSDAVAVDPALGAFFELSRYQPPGQPGNEAHDTLYIGSLTPGAAAPVLSTTFESYYEATFGSDTRNNTLTGFSIAVDTADHELFIPIGSDITAHNGLLVMSYSTSSSGVTTLSSTPRFLETSTGNEPPTDFNNGAVYDYVNKDVYIDDTDDSSGQVGTDNGLYRIPTTGAAPVSIVNNLGLNQIVGLALDAPDNRLFFATASEKTNGNPSTWVNSLYFLNNPSTASNTAPTKLTYASASVTPPFASGTPSDNEVVGVAYDDNSNVLYVASNYVVSGSTADYTQSVVYRLQLSTNANGSNGTEVTSFTTIPYTSLTSTTNPDGPPFSLITYDPLSSLTVAGTTSTVAKSTPTALLASAPTISDFDSGGYLASASVRIVDSTSGAAVTGDTLGLVEGGVFKTFTATPTTQTDNGSTFLVSYSGGVLTIANQTGSAGENTIAAYQKVLQDVQYENTSTDLNTRTVTVQVNNGAIGNPSGSVNTQSFNVALAQPPGIAAGGYTVPSDVVAGATNTATAPGALSGDTSPANSGTLSITAVQTSSKMGTVGAPLSGTYGSLTLNANGGYSYAASNTSAIAGYKTGSHPVDSYTFTVTNSGGSATETFNATIDRAPTGSGITVTAMEGATATGVAKAAFANETDPDGDALNVASVSYQNSVTGLTTTGTVGQSIAGAYGELTLNANGSYTYVADNTADYDAAVAAGRKPIDDFTYTSADPYGAATSPQTLAIDVTCYVTGTLISTARGDVAVEDLCVGDLAVTASGERRPIRWLGHRNVDLREHPRPQEAHPIRIAAHAFAPGRPSRDLLVSPGHSICVDVVGQVLIPAAALVNGSTIRQMIEVDKVGYWHVELDSHDILVANGLPAESYLEMGNRDFFLENDIVAFDISPDADPARRTHADFCRPFRERGKVVDGVREQLRLRAEALGWRLENDDLGDLHLVADGMRIDPNWCGLTVCFALPSGAKDVRLMSRTARPCDVETSSSDRRALGAKLRAIVLVDGFARREVALDDPRLREGFHEIEADGDISWRWTNGMALLPSALWADCVGPALLRLDLATAALPRWIAPAGATNAPREAAPALVA